MSITTRITKLIAQRLPETRYAEFISLEEAQPGTPTTIYLTFDDGPHIDRTPLLLDTLATLNLNATFFVLGKNMQQGKHLIRQAIEAGHSVGSHSWSHHKADETGYVAWVEDITKARKELEDITGKVCRLFRPPYGALSPRKLLFLYNNDYRTVQWSMDTKDYSAKTPEQLRLWFEQATPKAGAILLMHDVKQNTASHFKDAYMPWLNITKSSAIPMD